MTTKAKKFPQGNKLRLDFESLSSSLRHSWHKGDVVKAAATLSELSKYYPELLVTSVSQRPAAQKLEPQPNCYDTLKLGVFATEQEVVTGFFKQLRQVLRDSDMSKRSRRYVRLLDAAFVLRNPRLRLSHDLVAVSSWLKSGYGKAKPAQTIKPKRASFETTLTLKLLEQSGLVSAENIVFLHTQMKQAPGVSLDGLLESYLTAGELASVKLGELLIYQGQATLSQIVVALYDERNTGIRMAESLQTRGWLTVQVE